MFTPNHSNNTHNTLSEISQVSSITLNTFLFTPSKIDITLIIYDNDVFVMSISHSHNIEIKLRLKILNYCVEIKYTY